MSAVRRKAQMGRIGVAVTGQQRPASCLLLLFLLSFFLSFTMATGIQIVRVLPDNTVLLDRALALNASIFPATSESAGKYSSAHTWTTRLLQCQGALHLALQDNTAVGFIFVYRKHWPPESSLVGGQLEESWHIWLCGVDPAARGQGLLGRLFDSAKEGKSGMWTVNTFERRFGSMVSWLKGHGWEKICEQEPQGKSTWSRMVE